MTKIARAALAIACIAPATLTFVARPASAQEAQAQANTLVPSAPPTDPMIAAIITEGKDHSHVMDILHHIAVDIGARCTGSPELEQGEKWAVGQFKSFGCQEDHREKWDD